MNGGDEMTANSGDKIYEGKKKKKEITDADVQKRSVKMVVTHLKKKIHGIEAGIARLLDWIDEMDILLEEEGFDRTRYLEMRRNLYTATEWVFDVEVRSKLRSSWYSFGKAMEKKAPRK